MEKFLLMDFIEANIIKDSCLELSLTMFVLFSVALVEYLEHRRCSIDVVKTTMKYSIICEEII